MTSRLNHPIRNIYYLLSYAFVNLKEREYKNVATEEFDHIHDLFAAILVRGVTSLVKRGLHRDYRGCEEALTSVRGQILISETIKTQTLLAGKLACSFDEFILDSDYNRALKSVMLTLVRDGELKPENRKALRDLLPYFSEVIEIHPVLIRWNAFDYHRNNSSYRMLLGICRLVVDGLLITTDSGTSKLTSWIQDEEMHRLFERFVLNYYKIEHPELSAGAPEIYWDLDEGESSRYLPRMKTDVTLSKSDKRLIIDTKFYNKTMQQHTQFGTRSFNSANLYQIYSYVKNSESMFEGNVAGVLLYAMTNESITPDEDLMISGNRISIKTLDLGKDWQSIAMQLDDLCAWLDS